MDKRLMPPYVVEDSRKYKRYWQQAKRRTELLKSFYGLNSNTKFIDIGCGHGRMAYMLHKDCHYTGVDVRSNCIKMLKGEFDDCQFKHLNIKNTRYNPNGKHDLNEYKLPFGDNTFDIAIAFSVFTHIPLPWEGYLKEINRILKPNGVFMVTFFLKENEGKNKLKFKTETCKKKDWDHVGP